MAPFYIFLALLLQSTLIYANNESEEQEVTIREVLINPTDEKNPELRAIETDWLDLFTLPVGGLHPSSSSAKMAQATKSDKSPEEQLEDIKDIANQITLAIQSEMANLLSYALIDAEKEFNENGLRKRRSIESPMDSTQMVMRLLKHIKSNNEYQNIAIEKMMSAQEIADKFGIDFNPDAEILSDLAVASNKQAEELTSILKDAYDTKNATEIEFVPINNEPTEKSIENSYYSYSTNIPEKETIVQFNTVPLYEYMPERIPEPRPSVNHIHFEPVPQYNHYSYETQILPPPPHHHPCHPPVSHMPNVFEPTMFTPAPEYYPPYYPMEPITTTTTIVLPIEELIEPEPELVGEEFEETVTSKVVVDHGDEPGSATVNHVMTYTISEKSHFKTPQVEALPQQMQYYFFLM